MAFWVIKIPSSIDDEKANYIFFRFQLFFVLHNYAIVPEIYWGQIQS